MKTSHTAYCQLLTLALLSSLASCGRLDDQADLSADATVASPLTLALGNVGADGKVTFLAAGPLDTQVMDYCLLSAAGVCVTPAVALTAGQSTSERKIFQSPEAVPLTVGSVIKLTSTSTTAQKVELKLSLVAKPTVPGSTGLRWKAVLMASDQGNEGAWIKAFDNARETIKTLLMQKGVQATNIREMSLHPDKQSAQILPASAENLASSLQALAPKDANDACLVHMTSHGSREGFNLGYDMLEPSVLNAALDASCGQRPTVVLISACFSGLYVLDSSAVKKPNRIILTAASHDRTSFGCGVENQYTFWDSCLIDALPSATTWKQLAGTIQSCITNKERGMTPSLPQAFIGEAVQDLPLPRL